MLIDVSLCCDKNMLEQAYVTIKSVKDNSVQGNKLCFNIVREAETSEKELNLFQDLEDENTKINFYNINNYINNEDKKAFSIFGYPFTAASYRIFLPRIISDNVKRTIYLDCDLIVRNNLSELWNKSFDGHLLAAVKDFGVIYHIKKNDVKHKESVALKNLNLKNPENYFNSGVLLCNLEKMRKENFIDKCISVLCQQKNMIYLDQDVLNIVCNSDLQVLDANWNVITEFTNMKKDLLENLNEIDRKSFTDSLYSPAIIHYAGPIKPWESTEIALSSYWWQTARNTPFYEHMLMKSVRNLIKGSKFILWSLKLHYIFIKLLKSVTRENEFDKKAKQLKRLLKIFR